VIAGDTRINSSQLDGFAVARLLTNGALDTSFDGDGKQTINFGPSDDFGFGVAVDALNRVLVVGNYYNGSNNDFAIARLTNEGGLDPSFDGDGKQTFGFNTATGDTAYGVVIDSSSRVLVAGTTTQVSSHSFALARLTGDTTTASASINDGSAQRSRLTSLTIQFSTQVSFNGSPEQAFTLARVAGGTVTFAANVEVQSGVTVVTLDHFAGSETEFGSLADGRYTLTVLASQINVAGGAFDGDNDGRPGGDLVIGSAQGLFRMFGDVNGDQTVNGLDFGFFKNAFGTQSGDPNFLDYLDYNGDGVINGFDFGQFKLRFGTTLP